MTHLMPLLSTTAGLSSGNVAGDTCHCNQATQSKTRLFAAASSSTADECSVQPRALLDRCWWCLRLIADDACRRKRRNFTLLFAKYCVNEYLCRHE